MTMLETGKRERRKVFPPLHRRLEPAGSRIPQVLLPDMQVLEQGGHVMVLDWEKSVASVCKEALLCKILGGALAFLACSEAVAYRRVLVSSGIWVSACNEALACSAVFACNVVLVYTAVEDETGVWQAGWDDPASEPLETHTLLRQAERRLRQVPVDFHTHPHHHLQLSARQSRLRPEHPAEPVASSSSSSWDDLVHPDEDVVFGPNLVQSCSNHPQRLAHRRRQELAGHSASNHPRSSLSLVASFSSAPLCPRPHLAPGRNHPRLLQGLPPRQPLADRPGEVLARQLALAQRSSVSSKQQPVRGGEGTPADDSVFYSMCAFLILYIDFLVSYIGILYFIGWVAESMKSK